MASERDRVLAQIGVSRETAEALDTYVALLRRWQTVKNLVGPATLDQVWARHILDSAQLVPLRSTAKIWMDLGSGAGFPALVIATLLRDQKGVAVHLVESNGRKCAFLREVIRTLKLPAQVHADRIESVLASPPPGIEVLTARALASLSDLFRYGERLLTTGTVGLFPKGQDLADELTEAAKYWRIQASDVQSVTDPKARILIVEQLARRVPSDIHPEGGGHVD